MLCNKCHKNLATIRYAEVVDGKVKDTQLCKKCLEEHQEDPETGFNLTSDKPSDASWGNAYSLESEIRDSESFCKSCRTKLSDVLKNGKLGCPVCYKSFSYELESIMEGIHYGMQHRGKMPVLDDKRTMLRAGLQTKRTLLRSAVGRENYEEAISLRDEIKALEIELGIVEHDEFENAETSHGAGI